jgi:hypothetical protein
MRTNWRQNLEDEKSQNRHFRIGPLAQYARVLFTGGRSPEVAQVAPYPAPTRLLQILFPPSSPHLPPSLLSPGNLPRYHMVEYPRIMTI